MTGPSFRCSGATLTALADLADAMECDMFGFAVVGGSIEMVAAHSARLAILSATMSVEAGADGEMCHVLARFKASIKGFAKEKEIDISTDGANMVLRVGRRSKRVAAVDRRHMETPKYPAIPFVAHATVPLHWIRACCSESAPSDTAQLSIAGGEVRWKSEHSMGAFEDACEATDPIGDAVGLYTPERIAEVLGPAVGETVRISMASGLPIGFQYSLPNGTARAVLAQRADTE